MWSRERGFWEKISFLIKERRPLGHRPLLEESFVLLENSGLSLTRRAKLKDLVKQTAAQKVERTWAVDYIVVLTISFPASGLLVT